MNKPESPSASFDAIAPAWYNFRHYTIFKAELEALAKRWVDGKLLNLGCGHGADFLPFKNGFELYGVDYSDGMLQQANRFAHKHNFSVCLTQADLRTLPYSDDNFEKAIAVAAYHHLKGHSEQLKALKELHRVLKPEGEAFLTVWNRCQTRFWFKNKEILLPFKSRGRIIERYYYLFTFGELEKLVRQAGFSILRSAPESRYHLPIRTFARNICLLLKKS
ncbi:MAG: class I SAM-dependent methyltransferase [Dehalococcoidia bacterium]|nr:class I SAM-dependent methyltransferase [Dehalococcoidia bacterium]